MCLFPLSIAYNCKGSYTVESVIQCMSTVSMAFTGLSKNLHVMAEIFSVDDISLAGKTPLLVWDMMVNFGDILQKQTKTVHSEIWVEIPT